MHSMSWSFRGYRIQWNFLGQTAVSGCEDFPTLGKQLRPHLQGALVVGATNPPAHPEDGNGITYLNVGKPSHPDAAVNLIKCHGICTVFVCRVTWLLFVKQVSSLEDQWTITEQMVELYWQRKTEILCTRAVPVTPCPLLILWGRVKWKP